MLSADYRFEVENLSLFALCREFLFSEMFSLFSQISEFYQSALIFSENTVIFAEAAMWIASISCALSFLGLWLRFHNTTSFVIQHIHPTIL